MAKIGTLWETKGEDSDLEWEEKSVQRKKWTEDEIEKDPREKTTKILTLGVIWSFHFYLFFNNWSGSFY